MRCEAGAGWGVNVMNGISPPHVQANIQVCFICMEIGEYELNLGAAFSWLFTYLSPYFSLFAFPVITYVFLTSTHIRCALIDSGPGVNFE